MNRQPARLRHVVHLLNHYGPRGVPLGRESNYEPNPETVTLADVSIALNTRRIGPISRRELAISQG